MTGGASSPSVTVSPDVVRDVAAQDGHEVVEVVEHCVPDLHSDAFVLLLVIRSVEPGRAASGGVVIDEVAIEASDEKVWVSLVAPTQRRNAPIVSHNGGGQVLPWLHVLGHRELETQIEEVLT